MKPGLFAALVGVTVAAPQKPDYAAINGATADANGPVLNDDIERTQTAQLTAEFTLTSEETTFATAAKRAVSDSSANADVTESSYNAKLGSIGHLTTVQQGATYWINGGSPHNFYGNINNNGRIFVSQTSYLKTIPFAVGQVSAWIGHDADNGNLNNAAGALIQLNDYGSTSSSTYDWHIRSLQNNGTIQWCGRGDTWGSTYQMYSDIDAHNYGLISFEQYFNNHGASFIWRNAPLTTAATVPNIHIHGAFRIINVAYHNAQNVYGSGCWQIGKGGVLYLEDGTGVFHNPTGGPSLPGQSIIFQDSSAVLHMDPAVYTRNSNFGPQLYGFGTGNAIEFLQPIKSFGYSSSTGVLNVALNGGTQVNLKVGTGYVTSKFVQKNNPQKYNPAGYNAIFYSGTVPSQQAPVQCAIFAPTCSDLSGGLPSSGSWSTTPSASSRSSISTSCSDKSSTELSSSSYWLIFQFQISLDLCHTSND